MATPNPIDISGAVTPITPVSEQPVVSPTDETAVSAETPTSTLPDEVLKIPTVQAVFAGAPAAVSFDVKSVEGTDEAALIAKNKNALLESGINFYRSLKGDLGVMFNAARISGEDLKAADRAGKLAEIAPPADKVSQQIMSSGENHPALTAEAPSGAPAGPASNVPTPVPMSAPAPSAALARQRLAAQLGNLKPGAPTSGARPGAGRLLNSILKPVL